LCVQLFALVVTVLLLLELHGAVSHTTVAAAVVHSTTT
jgi:hypothetical protein